MATDTKAAAKAAMDGLASGAASLLADAGTDARAAAEFVRQYVAALSPDAEQIVEAAAQAAAIGQPIDTWLDAGRAQVDAVALTVLDQGELLSQKEVQRVRDVALGALHAAIALAVAA